MREIPVAVGEVDRRVLVTDIDAELLITCVWSRIGQMARHSTPRWRGTGASENKLVKRKSEEKDETERPKETLSEME